MPPTVARTRRRRAARSGRWTTDQLGSNELAWMDRGIRALADSDLNGGEQFDSILVLTSHVRNIAQQALTLPGRTTGLTEEHINQALAEILTTEAARFPSLAAAMQTAAGTENQGLEFGLDRILDGLEC
jgi:tetracycline repressor-like protein